MCSMLWKLDHLQEERGMGSHFLKLGSFQKSEWFANFLLDQTLIIALYCGKAPLVWGILKVHQQTWNFIGEILLHMKYNLNILPCWHKWTNKIVDWFSDTVFPALKYLPKHGQIRIFGACLSASNMVKWVVPEKILQNAVQFGRGSTLADRYSA